MVIVCESMLLVLLDSAIRSTSSANMVIVCVPLAMVQGPPSEPMVTDAPAARGPLTAPQVQYAPSTEYETPTTTPAGVAAVPWFFTTLVKMPVVLSYESEVGIRELRPKVGDGMKRGKAAYRGGVRRLHFSTEGGIRRDRD
jgi:hypothetical protein